MVTGVFLGDVTVVGCTINVTVSLDIENTPSYFSSGLTELSRKTYCGWSLIHIATLTSFLLDVHAITMSFRYLSVF